jgi:hypothetical protein
MTPGSDQRFTAFVGIDWADSKHDVCLQAADTHPASLLADAYAVR